MRRRAFLRVCTAAAAVGIAPALAANLRPRFYTRVQLVDAARRPLRAATLAANRNYIFHYPYAATPCFLLDLGKARATLGFLLALAVQLLVASDLRRLRLLGSECCRALRRMLGWARGGLRSSRRSAERLTAERQWPNGS